MVGRDHGSQGVHVRCDGMSPEHLTFSGRDSADMSPRPEGDAPFLHRAWSGEGGVHYRNLTSAAMAPTATANMAPSLIVRRCSISRISARTVAMSALASRPRGIDFRFQAGEIDLGGRFHMVDAGTQPML
ncbi:MAG: hypothetical protein FD149_1012 [Rhodospirillaceae bacterium]|nr:MAG: hypothetical protein FD149_1012 [Rhodospirillaceae bacterium]